MRKHHALSVARSAAHWQSWRWRSCVLPQWTLTFPTLWEILQRERVSHHSRLSASPCMHGTQRFGPRPVQPSAQIHTILVSLQSPLPQRPVHKDAFWRVRHFEWWPGFQGHLLSYKCCPFCLRGGDRSLFLEAWETVPCV